MRLGERARAAGLFLIPEEMDPPAELRDVEAFEADAEAARGTHPRRGFVRAVLEPALNAVHRALLGALRSLKPSIRATRREIVARAVTRGPNAVNAAEGSVLLRDPSAVDALHGGVWTNGDRTETHWRIRPSG